MVALPGLALQHGQHRPRPEPLARRQAAAKAGERGAVEVGVGPHGAEQQRQVAVRAGRRVGIGRACGGGRGGLGFVRRGVVRGLGFARRHIVVVGGRRGGDNLLLRFRFLDPGFDRGNIREGGVEVRLGRRGLVLVRQEARSAGAGEGLQLLARALRAQLGLAAVAQDQGPRGAGAGRGEVAPLLDGPGQELGLEVLGAGGAEVGAGDGLGEVAGVGAGGASSRR